MNVASGILLHMGISYVVTPSPGIDKRQFLAFQSALLDKGIDYGEAGHTDQEIHLSRKAPPLQIRIIAPNHPNQPIGQVVIVAPKPEEDVDMFGRQAQAITDAFSTTWPASKQLVTAECTIRYLYDSTKNHAFEEIWEGRLRQPKDALKELGSLVGGGGLRFVMPAMQSEPGSTEKEVKIESFLQNPKKLYVDVRFKWPRIARIGAAFEPDKYLNAVDRYIEEKVVPFVQNDPWSELDLE